MVICTTRAHTHENRHKRHFLSLFLVMTLLRVENTGKSNDKEAPLNARSHLFVDLLRRKMLTGYVLQVLDVDPGSAAKQTFLGSVYFLTVHQSDSFWIVLGSNPSHREEKPKPETVTFSLIPALLERCLCRVKPFESNISRSRIWCGGRSISLTWRGSIVLRVFRCVWVLGSGWWSSIRYLIRTQRGCNKCVVRGGKSGITTLTMVGNMGLAASDIENDCFEKKLSHLLEDELSRAW